MKENIVKIILGVVAGVLVIALAVETVLWNNDSKTYKTQIVQMQSELEECKKTVDEMTTYKEEAETYKEEIETYKVEIDRLKELEEAYNELSSLEVEETENSNQAELQTEEAKEEVVETTPAPTPAPAPSVPTNELTEQAKALFGGDMDNDVTFGGGEW